MSKYLQESYEDALRDNALLKTKLEQAKNALELIAKGNNDFPTWEDTVDILIGVRSVASEALQAIRGSEK